MKIKSSLICFKGPQVNKLRLSFFSAKKETKKLPAALIFSLKTTQTPQHTEKTHPPAGGLKHFSALSSAACLFSTKDSQGGIGLR